MGGGGLENKVGGGFAPTRQYSRSLGMQQQLTVARLLREYLKEDLTAGMLLRLLGNMAETLNIDNWAVVNESAELVVLQSLPENCRVWNASHPDNADFVKVWSGFNEVWAATKKVLEHIQGNIEHGRQAFHNGLEVIRYVDSIIKDKLSGFAPGKAVLSKDELHRGRELRVMSVEGESTASLAALPAALLDELLRTKAWQYLKTCSVCGKPFVPKRLGAVTCSPRCRKRRSLDKEE